MMVAITRRKNDINNKGVSLTDFHQCVAFVLLIAGSAVAPLFASLSSDFSEHGVTAQRYSTQR